MTGLTDRVDRTMLRRLAASGPNHLEVCRRLLEALGNIVEFDAGILSTVDPATLLWTSCVRTGFEASPEQERFIFQNEYCEDDLHKIDWLANGHGPVGVLSLVDEAARRNSRRYSWLRQFGVADELRAALLQGGDCWGSLVLYRIGNGNDFGVEQADLVASVSPLMAQAIRTTLLRRAAACAAQSPDTPGIVTVDETGHVATISGAAGHWLQQLQDDHSRIPAIRSLIQKLRASEDGTASAMAPAGSGQWIRLHASWLEPDPQQKAIVILEPARGVQLAGVLARAYGLTERERDVTMWIARGLSSKEIAQKLEIAAMTVNDHLKSVFGKVGVQSRQQLIATLFFDHYVTSREQSAVPGPYGWFLDG